MSTNPKRNHTTPAVFLGRPVEMYMKAFNPAA